TWRTSSGSSCSWNGGNGGNGRRLRGQRDHTRRNGETGTNGGRLSTTREELTSRHASDRSHRHAQRQLPTRRASRARPAGRETRNASQLTRPRLAFRVSRAAGAAEGGGRQLPPVRLRCPVSPCVIPLSPASPFDHATRTLRGNCELSSRN